MDEAQVILDFLFPPHQQAAGAVHPRMGSFHHPASGALSSTTAASFFASTLNVRDVPEPPDTLLAGFAEIALVEAQMLPLTAGAAGARQRNRTQRDLQQFLIVDVGARDGDTQRHAAAIRQHRPFDAELTAIGGVFAGFFPRPAVTSSALRPTLAIAT